MPYDPRRDLEPITVAVSQPSVLVVASKHSAASAKDFLAMVKGSQAKLSFASIGAGSISHLAMETVASRSGADFVHVPYRGSGAAVTAVLTGEVDMALLPAAAVMPHIKAGKIRGWPWRRPSARPLCPSLPTSRERPSRCLCRRMDRLHRACQDPGSDRQQAA
jgi:tripartite-type tricarboxylate transporter receptor subunit TctC